MRGRPLVDFTDLHELSLAPSVGQPRPSLSTVTKDERQTVVSHTRASRTTGFAGEYGPTSDPTLGTDSTGSGTTTETACARSVSSDYLRQKGPDSTCPLNRIDRCAISGRSEPYLRVTTRGRDPLAGLEEAAGPLTGSVVTASNTLGNIRVHAHDGGVQVWVLSNRRGAPTWEDVLTGLRYPHPVLNGYVLGTKRGKDKPTWVKDDSCNRYARVSGARRSDVPSDDNRMPE